MKLALFSVGRLKEAYWQEAEADYVKRLKRHARLEIREFKSNGDLIAAIPKGALCVFLDFRGEQIRSEDLAALVHHEQSHGGGRTVVFCIGAAQGFSDSDRKAANKLIAFGRITLPHRIARVLLVEQLVRAFAILCGEPYHK